MAAGEDVGAAVREAGDGVELDVKVVPGASRSAVVGMLGKRLKVTVAAPAEGGKANKAVCVLIAKQVGVSKSAVSVVSGHTRPEKVILVMGVTAAQVRSGLER